MPVAAAHAEPSAYDTSPNDASAELARQARSWADLGHPVPEVAVKALQRDLRRVPALAATRERVPFVLVNLAAVRPAEAAMARIELRGRPGTVNQHAGDIDDFTPIERLGISDAAAYVLLDVERGSEFCGTAPEPAEAVLRQRGRTPLTVSEGIALITLYPDMLEKNHCFSLAGSRKGDRRVPALWISKGAPHLGWCFAGAPHSWLGLASAAGRLAAA